MECACLLTVLLLLFVLASAPSASAVLRCYYSSGKIWHLGDRPEVRDCPIISLEKLRGWIHEGYNATYNKTLTEGSGDGDGSGEWPPPYDPPTEEDVLEQYEEMAANHTCQTINYNRGDCSKIDFVQMGVKYDCLSVQDRDMWPQGNCGCDHTGCICNCNTDLCNSDGIEFFGSGDGSGMGEEDLTQLPSLISTGDRTTVGQADGDATEDSTTQGGLRLFRKKRQGQEEEEDCKKRLPPPPPTTPPPATSAAETSMRKATEAANKEASSTKNGGRQEENKGTATAGKNSAATAKGVLFESGFAAAAQMLRLVTLRTFESILSRVMST